MLEGQGRDVEKKAVTRIRNEGQEQKNCSTLNINTIENVESILGDPVLEEGVTGGTASCSLNTE